MVTLPHCFLKHLRGIPDASPPISRSVRRGKVPSFLLVTLVGILALAVLASGTGVLVSLLHRQPNSPPPPFKQPPARSNRQRA